MKLQRVNAIFLGLKDSQWVKRCFEAIASGILENCKNMDFRHAGLIHFMISQYSDSKIYTLDRMLIGERVLGVGFIYVNINLDALKEKSLIEQRHCFYQIITEYLKEYSKQFNLNIDFTDFDKSADFFKQNEYRNSTKVRKTKEYSYYLTWERNLTNPAICRFHYKFKNEDYFNEFIVDYVDNIKEPVVSYPEVIIDKSNLFVVIFRYWQRKIIYDMNTKSVEYINQPADRLDNIFLW